MATPVDWHKGEDCMVLLPVVEAEDAKTLFPKGVTVHQVPSGKVS